LPDEATWGSTRKTTRVGLRGGIYQRRTKNGIGRRKKTVPFGTAKTQRMEAAGAVSAIDEEVRFLIIFLCLSCKEKL
jgi:hypothetical protein